MGVLSDGGAAGDAAGKARFVARRPERRRGWLNGGAGIAAIIPIVVVSLGLFNAFGKPLNHDAAWLLHISREVLDGARLYTDIIEINPPLIVWLGVPIILLERATNVSHTTLFPGLVALAAALSLFASNKLSRHVLDHPSRAAFLLASALALFVLPANDWGQREHITVLLTLPYITACACRVRGVHPRHGWIIGMAAGLGFALKPHFIIAFIALEAWVVRKHRSAWSGSMLAAGSMAVYWMVVVAFTDYRPLVSRLSDVYATYDPTAAARLAMDYRSLFALAVLGFALVAGEGRELRQAFGVVTAAWLLVFICQEKGFGYHFVPAMAGSISLVILATQTVSRRRVALGAASLVALIIGFVPIVVAPPGLDPRWHEIHEVRAHVESMPAVMLSPSSSDAWPHMSYAGARWQAPVPSTWSMLSSERGHRLAVQWMTPVVEAGVPVLVPIDPAGNALPRLLEDTRFREAWAAYALVSRGRYFELFKVPE